MNKVVLICLALTISLGLFSVFYFIPYFSKKKIRQGKFDLLQFINLFFSPILIIPLLYFLRQIILSNPLEISINYPKYASELIFLGLLYLMVLGHGIHSVSVVLSKHMKDLTQHAVWEINEFFHHKFSHWLTSASAVLILFSFSILEINHPNVLTIETWELGVLVITGMLCGIVLGIASIEGSIPTAMFLLIYSLSVILPFIFIRFRLDFRLFPFSTFLETALILGVITISFYKYKRRGFPEIVPQYFFEK